MEQEIEQLVNDHVQQATTDALAKLSSGKQCPHLNLSGAPERMMSYSVVSCYSPSGNSVEFELMPCVHGQKDKRSPDVQYSFSLNRSMLHGTNEQEQQLRDTGRFADHFVQQTIQLVLYQVCSLLYTSRKHIDDN